MIVSILTFIVSVAIATTVSCMWAWHKPRSVSNPIPPRTLGGSVPDPARLGDRHLTNPVDPIVPSGFGSYIPPSKTFTLNQLLVTNGDDPVPGGYSMMTMTTNGPVLVGDEPFKCRVHIPDLSPRLTTQEAINGLLGIQQTPYQDPEQPINDYPPMPEKK